jgi:phage shock protein A
MNESISSRVGRIISGSLNAIVDAVESAAPEAVMQEAIREVDGAIDEVRVELGKVIASKHMASTRLMSENQKHTDLAEKLELAIKEGRDDLAETAISTQLDIEAQIPVLESTISDMAAKEKELEGYIAALKAKKNEMQNELEQFQQAQKEASVINAQGEAISTDGVDRDVEKASSTFERVIKNASGVSSRITNHDRESAEKMAELDALAKKNRIQERLAEVKKSL